MGKFIVKTTGDWYLRGTAWTSDPARANQFADDAAARAALLKAKPFMKAASFRKATVIPAPDQEIAQ